jgi:tetratricopeptide (TPR) repeat protein
VTLLAKDKTAFAPAEKMKINKKIGISLKKINDYKKAIQYFLKALGVEGDTPKSEKA